MKAESFVLIFILLGIFALGLGTILYARKIMAVYEVGWELQLAFFGLIVIALGLLVSKLLSKVG